MARAVAMVRALLLEATAVLEQARIQYAVIGGNAVAAWIATVDQSAVRNTPDVDILIRRADLAAARDALKKVGIALLLELFPRAPEAVHALVANEKVRQEDILPAADMTETMPGPGYRMLTLDALVRMKLTSFRTIDRVHLRDMLSVGLVDAAWLTRIPPELAVRLQHLLDTPDG
jgi:hypothetical protein